VLNEQQKNIAEFLHLSREVSAQHLPIGHSFIPFDLLLQVCLHEVRYQDQPLSMKALFASLPYSDMGVRYHLRRLIENEWIVIDKNDMDPRMRSVSATDKTFTQFATIADYLAEHPDSPLSPKFTRNGSGK
jgi:hypothetical protein